MEIPRLVKCVRVDHNGFCGRNYHPSDEMIGRTFVVGRIEIEGIGEIDEVFGDLSYAVIICSDGTPHGSVEFVEHEVEAVETTARE